MRAIAAAAGVNPTYVGRYFGSKRALMQAAMLQAQLNIAHVVDEMPNVVDGATAVVHASLREKEFVTAIARMMLDGDIDELPPENPALRGLLQRFEDELARRPGAAARDPRIIVLCLASAMMGYALFGEFIRRGVDLDERACRGDRGGLGRGTAPGREVGVRRLTRTRRPGGRAHQPVGPQLLRPPLASGILTPTTATRTTATAALMTTTAGEGTDDDGSRRDDEARRL